MDRRVGVVIDPEQRHLTVLVMHPSHGARGDVRRQPKRVGEDLLGLRSHGREGLRVVAPRGTGQTPERVRDDAEIDVRTQGTGVEGLVAVAFPGGHDQGPVRSQGIPQRRDQPLRPTVDRTDRPERGVHEQNSPDSTPRSASCYTTSTLVGGTSLFTRATLKKP